MERHFSSSFPSVTLKSKSIGYWDIWLSNGEPKSEPKGEPKKCLTSTVGGDKEGIPQKNINKNNTLSGVMVETRGIEPLTSTLPALRSPS